MGARNACESEWERGRRRRKREKIVNHYTLLHSVYSCSSFFSLVPSFSFCPEPCFLETFSFSSTLINDHSAISFLGIKVSWKTSKSSLWERNYTRKVRERTKETKRLRIPIGALTPLSRLYRRVNHLIDFIDDGAHSGTFAGCSEFFLPLSLLRTFFYFHCLVSAAIGHRLVRPRGISLPLLGPFHFSFFFSLTVFLVISVAFYSLLNCLPGEKQLPRSESVLTQSVRGKVSCFNREWMSERLCLERQLKGWKKHSMRFTNLRFGEWFHLLYSRT